jgi:hypothetical protein
LCRPATRPNRHCATRRVRYVGRGFGRTGHGQPFRDRRSILSPFDFPGPEMARVQPRSAFPSSSGSRGTMMSTRRASSRKRRRLECLPCGPLGGRAVRKRSVGLPRSLARHQARRNQSATVRPSAAGRAYPMKLALFVLLAPAASPGQRPRRALQCKRWQVTNWCRLVSSRRSVDASVPAPVGAGGTFGAFGATGGAT